MATDTRPSVVITGASSGIGQAAALWLARQGWRVFAGVRREQDGESLRSQFLATSGPDHTNAGDVFPLLLDVTREHDMARAVETVQARLAGAPLDGLVNNAGWLCMGPVEVVPVDDVRRQLEVNVVGALRATQAFVPALRAGGRGRIVHISSSSGRSALPFLGPYAASKFALEALADSMRIELHRFGIRVVLVEPGPVVTPLLDKNLSWLDALEARLGDAERQLYQRELAIARHFAAASNRTAMPVQRVVDTIHTALTTPRPKARYRIGNSSSGIRFLEALPTGLRDWLIRFKLARVKPETL